MNRESFKSFLQLGAAQRQILFGKTGEDGKPIPCKIGTTAATAVPLQAYCSAYREDLQNGEGGFGSLAPRIARWLKKGNPVPQHGQLFYDGTRWLEVGTITNSDSNPEWVVELQPLNQAGQG